MDYLNLDSGAISQEVVVQNRQGLHLRPAAKIVKAVANLNCEVKIRKENKVANAKSIMSVTTLIATKGTVLTIEANGPDAASAVARLVQLFDEKFHED